MKYENIKVLHGTPKEVEKKLNDYFKDAHPKAAVISTSLALSNTLVPDEEAAAEEAEAAAKAAKSTAKNPPAEGTTPPAPSATAELIARTMPMKLVTHTTMVATVGIAYE